MPESAEHAACRRRTVEEEEYLINREADLPTIDDRLGEILAEKPWADILGQEDEFHAAVVGVYQDARDLLLKKHHDYGPHNIGRSPGGPLNGLRVRMWDKIARINNLLDSGKEPSNESLRDSFIDLANYSVIALLVIDGNWPSE